MHTPLAVIDAVLIDGNGNSPVPDSVVIIADRKFTAVGAHAATQIPDGADIIDAADSYLILCLMNGNVHLLDGIMMMGVGGIEYLARHEGAYHHVIEEAAQIALKHGVTMVFDTGMPSSRFCRPAIASTAARPKEPGCSVPAT
ncbi:Uncharacterised protein [Mycobacteroides abscessus subsp. massiliense]|nr:Uncharacterised protein [Mycobacteroides abscessus subsp. massiliense]